MRSAQMIAEAEELAGNGAELNLGMGSLIGIFFGLALVCGVFFGFGYMMGHRPAGPYVSAEPLYESPQPAAVAPKPSAQTLQQPTEASRVVLSTAQPAETPAQPPTAKNVASASPAPARAAAAMPATPLKPQPIASAAPPASIPATATGTIMVQIAAVRNRPDAEALAAAIRKNGFNPTIRAESGDKLFHIQVGPFASRDEAKTMRQKLSSAGYNAFIK